MDQQTALRIMSQYATGDTGVLEWALWHTVEQRKEAEYKRLFTTDDVICDYLDSKNLFNRYMHGGCYEAKQHLRVSFVAGEKRVNIHMWVDNQISPQIIHYPSTDIKVGPLSSYATEFNGHIFDVHNGWMKASDNRHHGLILREFGEDTPLVEKCLGIIMRQMDNFSFTVQ